MEANRGRDDIRSAPSDVIKSSSTANNGRIERLFRLRLPRLKVR